MPSRRALVRGVAATLAIGLGLACWPAVWAAVSHHEYFAVREVVVCGHRRLAPDAIRRLARIEPGMSVWTVDSRDAEARLRREPWVRTAYVHRHLPHRVVIQIREERAAAILATDSTLTPRANGAPTLYYVAPQGRIVAPVGAREGHDFPYLTGLSADDLAEGEAFGPRAIRQALRLVRTAARTRAVSEVHIDRARGLTLLPVAPPVPIEVGWGGYAEKLGRLPAVLARWAGREGDIAAINLLFRDEVIVRTRPTKPVPPARPAAKA
jgi:cell division septal protein FtsQ